MEIERRILKNGAVQWRVRWRQGGRRRSQAFDRKGDAVTFSAELRRRQQLGTLTEMDMGRVTLADYGSSEMVVATLDTPGQRAALFDHLPDTSGVAAGSGPPHRAPTSASCGIAGWTFYPRGVAIIVCPSCGARNRVGPIAAGFPRCPRCKSELPWLVDADAESFAAETSASVPVVVDFWAAWCGPCRMISPVLEDLAGRHAGRLKVVKVDVDANPGLAARFGAQSIPLLVVIRDGHEVDRIVGALPRAALEQRLRPLIAS